MFSSRLAFQLDMSKYVVQGVFYNSRIICQNFVNYTISINESGYDLFQFTLFCFHINVDVNIQMLDGA